MSTLARVSVVAILTVRFFPPASAVHSGPRTLTVSWAADAEDLDKRLRNVAVGAVLPAAGWVGAASPWGSNDLDYVTAKLHNPHLVSLTPPTWPVKGQQEVLVITYDSVTVGHRDTKTAEELTD